MKQLNLFDAHPVVNTVSEDEITQGLYEACQIGIYSGGKYI